MKVLDEMKEKDQLNATMREIDQLIKYSDECLLRWEVFFMKVFDILTEDFLDESDGCDVKRDEILL